MAAADPLQKKHNTRPRSDAMLRRVAPKSGLVSGQPLVGASSRTGIKITKEAIIANEHMYLPGVARLLP